MDGKYSKEIFAKNLRKLIEQSGKNRREICEELNFSYYTFNDWVNAKKFPRIDKLEMLQDYFGCTKSDLLEEPMTEEKEKDNEVIVDLIVRMRMDKDFLEAVVTLHSLDDVKFKGIQEMLKAFAK